MCLELLGGHLRLVNEQILETDRRIRTSARATEAGRRLMTIPGVGLGAQELGKGKSELTHPAGRTGRRENPVAPERFERVLLVGTHLRGRHYGQRPVRRANRSNTWPHRPA